MTNEIELVISGPEPYGAELVYTARARTTLGVLVQLLSQASSNVVLAAPFLQAELLVQQGVLAQALQGAMARSVRLELMTTQENLRLPLLKDLTEQYQNRIRLFHPALPLADASAIGSHAKFCIQDGAAAYIGSANLTAPALGGTDGAPYRTRQHFEMGVLVKGEIAARLRSFWVHCVRFGLFAEMKHDSE